MKKWISKYKLMIIGVIAGFVSGYLYYYFVGCSSGTCMITSNPIISTLYFGILGGLLMNIIKPADKTQKQSIK